MFTSLRTFNAQVDRHKAKGLCRFPYRYFLNWRSSLLKDSSSIEDHQPWLTFEVTDFLEKNITFSHRIFEYGGGGSTLFFTSRAAEVVTVEHNREWFGILDQKLSSRQNWRANLIMPQQGNLGSPVDPSVPEHYASTDESTKGFNYRNYASSIDSFSEGYFDLVLVDGRSRPACIVHALSRIKKGGWLILDNSERTYYLKRTAELISRSFRPVINNYGPSPYSWEFTRTTVWKKIRC